MTTKKKYNRFYSEQVEFVKEKIKEHYMVKEITELLNKEFNQNYSFKSVSSLIYKRLKLKTNNNSKFKDNHKPYKHKEVGEEYIDKYNDCVLIKIAEPNTWVQKHRYIWEQHYGKIPEGYFVLFLDKNRRNFDIDNLALVSQKDYLKMLSTRTYSENKDITKLAILNAQMMNKTNERRKNGNI